MPPPGAPGDIALDYPTALTPDRSGNFYVSTYRVNNSSMVVRFQVGPDGGGALEAGYVSIVAGVQDPAVEVPTPDEGLEAAKVKFSSVTGVAWNALDAALIVGAGASGDIWEVRQLPQFPDRRFTKLSERTPTEDPTRWILDERNGTQHRFDAAGRHRRSLDRWGNQRSYDYDGLGRLTTVNWPGGSQTVLNYADSHVQTASLVPAGGGNGPVVTFDIDGSGDLVSLESGTDFKRQFEYDESHRLTARYHGDAVTPPAFPARYVEYTYDHGMVGSVTFHDTDADGQPVPEVVNRVYTHSREHGLVNEAPAGTGTPTTPIAVDSDVGWDSVLDAVGIETRTRLDPKGRTLEVERITGSETARTVYQRNASGFITQMCYYGSQASSACDYEETYDYDDLGNLTTVTVHDPESPASSQWTYYYAAGDQTVEGHDVEFTLGAMVVNPEGELLSRTYDDFGNLTELQLATAWHEDEQTGLPVVDSSNRALWNYGAFPEQGLPFKAYSPVCTAAQVPEDCRTVFTYDNNRNLTKVDPADESYTELTRNPARGWVTGIAEPVFVGGDPGALAEADWTLQRDDWGRPIAVSGPSTGTTNLVWTDPLTGGGCASCSAGDKLAEVVGPAAGGQTARPLTKYAYDLAGRLLRTRTGFRETDPNPNDVFVRSVTYVRDGAGRVTGMQVDGTQTIMSAVYGEDSGLLESLSVALGGGQSLEWLYEHDLLDRPSLVVAPDDGHWEYDYDFLSGVTQVTETGTGRTTRFERDGVGRITKRILDDGVTQNPETDPVWSYAYDSIGQFVDLQEPTGKTTTLSRNANGAITGILRNGNPVDASEHDGYNRTTQVSRTTDGLETRYDFTYNDASALSSIRPSWHTGNPVVETLALKHRYLYDGAGRPAAVEAWHDTPGHFATGVQLAMSYHYDNAGRLDEVAVVAPATPTGSSLQGRVALARDAAGRLERLDFKSRDIEDSNGNGNTLEYVVRKRTVVSYEPASSRLKTIKTGNPGPNNTVPAPDLVDLTYTYDPAGRITAQETATPEAPGWWKRTYAYDPASRLTEALDYVPSTENPLPWLNRWAWTYNTAGERTGQTVQFDAPGGTPLQTSLDEGYSWDAYGVLDKTHPTGSPAGTLDDFTFDAAGNLQTLVQADGTTLTFAYDPSGRTKTITVGGSGPNSDGTIVTYRYGPDERLTERTVDLLGDSTIDSVTRYFSDGLISWEIDGITGNLLRAVVFLLDGFTPLMIVTFAPPPPTVPPAPPAPQPGTIYFVQNDHLSTPKAVTDLTGTPVWLARHAPFGQVEELCGPNGVPNPSGPPVPGPCSFQQPLRFPGQVDQREAHPALAGIWYNWHRFYLPKWGMYSRRDPRTTLASK